MAKDSKETIAAENKAQSAAPRTVEQRRTVALVTRRPIAVHDAVLPIGAPVAEVTLERGVTMPWLGRAIDDGLVGEPLE